jgi:hypothetical protein
MEGFAVVAVTLLTNMMRRGTAVRQRRQKTSTKLVRGTGRTSDESNTRPYLPIPARVA